MDYNFNQLHTSRQNPLLINILKQLFIIEELKEFRLVGGTNLALIYDHRYSADIDLFTDKEYGSVNFTKIESILKSNFAYVDTPQNGPSAFGKTYFIGNSKDECIKIDIMYTDNFLDSPDKYGIIPFATRKDLVAMKMEAVNTGPRKKDFWDIHLLLDYYSLEDMLSIHRERHPYSHNRNDILDKLVSFENVETDPDPICYLDKNWQDIKLDIIFEVEKIK